MNDELKTQAILDASRKNREAMRVTLLAFQAKITAIEQKVLEGNRTITSMQAKLAKVEQDHILFRLQHTGSGPTV